MPLGHLLLYESPSKGPRTNFRYYSLFYRDHPFYIGLIFWTLIVIPWIDLELRPLEIERFLNFLPMWSIEQYQPSIFIALFGTALNAVAGINYFFSERIHDLLRDLSNWDLVGLIFAILLAFTTAKQLDNKIEIKNN